MHLRIMSGALRATRTVKNIALVVKELIHSLWGKKAKLHRPLTSGLLKAKGSDTLSEMIACIKGRETMVWKWVRTSWREWARGKEHKKGHSEGEEFHHSSEHNTSIHLGHFFPHLRGKKKCPEVNNCGNSLANLGGFLCTLTISGRLLWLCLVSGNWYTLDILPL